MLDTLSFIGPHKSNARGTGRSDACQKLRHASCSWPIAVGSATTAWLRCRATAATPKTDFQERATSHSPKHLLFVQNQRFETHLAECPTCVAYLDNYRKTIQL